MGFVNVRKTVRDLPGTLNDGFFQARALREARARALPPEKDRARALQQAKLLIETARRTADPIEPLPAGSRPAVLLALYRDAVHWALLAVRPLTTPAPPDLRGLWAEIPPEALPSSARPDVARTGLEELLFGPSVGRDALAASDEDARRLRALAEGLVQGLDAPRQQADQILTQRWFRFIMAGAVVLLLGFGASLWVRGPNLIKDKPIRTSSTWSGCATDAPCTRQMFHTAYENNPWVEFDLGAPQPIRRIEIENRKDCCSDRAVPLIAEVGSDRSTWTEVARQEKDFSKLTLKFAPVTARYVRLRVPRETVLHFKHVAVR